MTACNCGSGEPRWSEYDGYGIFLGYVCRVCQQRFLARFRSDIKTRYEADEPIEEDAW